MKDPEPMFVRSMFANGEELYKAKSEHYQKKAEAAEAELSLAVDALEKVLTATTALAATVSELKTL